MKSILRTVFAKLNQGLTKRLSFATLVAVSKKTSGAFGSCCNMSEHYDGTFTKQKKVKRERKKRAVRSKKTS